MAGHRPFSELTKDWTPERKAEVAAMSKELKAEYEARQPAKQPTNNDLYEFLFEVQDEIFELRRQVSDLHVLVEKQFGVITSLLEKSIEQQLNTNDEE